MAKGAVEQGQLYSGGEFEVDTTLDDRDLTVTYPSHSTGRATKPVRALIFDSGTLVVKDIGGNTVTLTSAYAGVVLPIQATEIVASGTTAATVLLIW